MTTWWMLSSKMPDCAIHTHSTFFKQVPVGIKLISCWNWINLKKHYWSFLSEKKTHFSCSALHDAFQSDECDFVLLSVIHIPIGQKKVIWNPVRQATHSSSLLYWLSYFQSLIREADVLFLPSHLYEQCSAVQTPFQSSFADVILQILDNLWVLPEDNK